MKRPVWQTQGKEPDYRFSLANERTFLAWIRTGLALLAGGVLLDQFVTRLGPSSVTLSLAIGLTLLAAGLCAVAFVRWRANEIAMRMDAPLPFSLALPVLSGALLLLSVVLGFLMAWNAR